MKKIPCAINCLERLIKGFNVRLVIGGSFPMRWMRDIKDLDVCIHPDDIHILLDRRPFDGIYGTTEKGGAKYTILDMELPIELFPTSEPPGFGYTDLLPEGYDSFAGVPCWKLSQCVRWKRAFKREKDIRDLELIARTLSAD